MTGTILFYFCDPSCQGSIHENSEIICKCCQKSLYNFEQLCVWTTSLAEVSLHENTRNDLLLYSPLVIKLKMKRVQVDLKKMDWERWVCCRHKKILEHSEINITQKQINSIAPDNIEELGKKSFEKKKIGQDILCR